MEIHVPRKYTAERPAVRFSNTKYDVRIEEHPLACRLPKKTGKFLSVQEGCHTFRSFSVPQNLPNNIQHYLTTDEPLISLYIISFTNATLVSISFPHLASDVMGTAEILKAWSSVLAGRLDRVPTVLGAREDVIETVGTPSDVKAQIPYVLQEKQIKGLSMLLFAVRFGWDLLTRRNIQARTIFLPAKFMSQLRQRAQEQLELGSNSENVPFLSHGDLITAWCARMVMSSRSKKRPTVICNVFDLRNRLKDTFTPGGSYLQNLILPASVFLPAAEVSTTSFVQIALRLRQAIVEQATDTQARSLMKLMKASSASTGLMPLFGSSDSMIIACTNWSKAKFLEVANFGPAAISSGQSFSGRNSAVQPGTCVSYWGTTIGKNDNPRDTFVIYGEDGAGDHWVHAYLRSQTWDLIQDVIQDELNQQV